MPVVLNRRGPLPVDLRNCAYVGRPTKWGNPFSHLSGTLSRWSTRTRAESVLAYRGYLLTKPHLIAAARVELRGKDLMCWCAPLACHADVLLEVANGR